MGKLGVCPDDPERGSEKARAVVWQERGTFCH